MQENQSKPLSHLFTYSSFGQKLELHEIDRELKNHWVLKSGLKIKKTTLKAEGRGNGESYKKYDENGALVYETIKNSLEYKRMLSLFSTKIGCMSFGELRKIDTKRLLELSREMSSILGG